MEKILEIDGKKVPFKTSGAFFMRYKQQFKQDPIKDIMLLSETINGSDGQDIDLSNIDTEILFNLCWCLAKNANPELPIPMEWLETFEVFPVFDVIVEVIDLIVASMVATKSLKKTQKMAK